MDHRNASDIDKFQEVVDHYSDRLFRFAFMRIGNREQAEDMVQDVLLRLYRALAGATEIRNVEAFLVRSINNACIDHLRRRKPPTLQLDHIHNVADEADSDIDREFMRVRRLLDGLPSEQAEIIRLKSYDGLTFRQIAQLQDLPESTVKSRYRYAIQHIRKKLKNDF